MNSETPSADHDLLIEVNTNVKNLTTTLNGYTSTANQITQDHELRLRALEADNQLIKGGQRTQKSALSVIAVVGGVVATALAIIQFLGFK